MGTKTETKAKAPTRSADAKPQRGIHADSTAAPIALMPSTSQCIAGQE